MDANRPEELPVVAALRSISIFGAAQGGAYREHWDAVAVALGPDVPTRLAASTREWAASGAPGVRILTGNAGTGKTAVAQAFCEASGGLLPTGPGSDALIEIAPSRYVIKDLSGLGTRNARASELEAALGVVAQGGQALVCANEGVLRDAADDLGDLGGALRELLESALRAGVADDGAVLVVNVNRQRPTAAALWGALVDFVAREELWEPGCDSCPGDASGSGCPMRGNAAALRRPEPREALRLLVQLGSGEAVPTMREVLAILAWALVAGGSCAQVKREARDSALQAHTAEDAYFHRAVGGGLRPEASERSPLLSGMRSAGLGAVSDLEVDEWLRDSSNAPDSVRALAGSAGPGQAGGRLAGTRSPHDRVRTGVGCMTFHALGEAISTSEDLDEVRACLDALVGAGGDAPRQALWRRRVFFEAPDALGGRGEACARLLDARYASEFLALAAGVAAGKGARLELVELVKGLNFLVCGFSSANEGLIVPDQACLFARDPGSFRPARPSLVHGSIALDDLALNAPDRGPVTELLDVDHLDLELAALGDAALALRIRPRLYEAIREAAAFQGPVGQGTAEMTDVRAFYGRLASSLPEPVTLRVADPSADPPALITLNLPHFAG